MRLFDCIYGLILLLVLVGIIVRSIIGFIIEIKCSDLFIKYRFLGGSCWGMKGCGNNNCRLRHFCHIYQNAVKPEDVAELEKMLDERGKELEIEKKCKSCLLKSISAFPARRFSLYTITSTRYVIAAKISK